MSEKKYIVVPGRVRSLDGDIHFISAHELMRLYGVSPIECVVMPEYDPEHPKWREYDRGYLEGLIQLYPMSNGDYSLPNTPAGEGEEG